MPQHRTNNIIITGVGQLGRVIIRPRTLVSIDFWQMDKIIFFISFYIRQLKFLHAFV